ncbi:MAG: hypothetical protein ACOCRO_10135 [Halanaerobiales bacterium]
MTKKKDILLYTIIIILVITLLSIFIYSKFLVNIETKVYFANQQGSHLIAEEKKVKKNQLYTNLIQKLIK